MTQESNTKPDAFKAVLAAARSEFGRPELAHQSLGRTLTAEEEALADALMEIYATGISGPEAVAAALAKKAVACPSSGNTAWSAEGLASELAALNASLDQAYEESGFGG